MMWERIKAILIISGVLFALLGATLGAIALADQASANQRAIQNLKTERYDSRYDLCEQLRDIVIAVTPKGKLHSPQLHVFYTETGLTNCVLYAKTGS